MSGEKTTALALVGDVGGYAVMQGNPQELGAAIFENLAGDGVSQFDLFRIKVPSGGGVFFNIPSLDNPDGEQVKELLGVIIYHQINRTYWENPNPVQGTLPDCSSSDGTTGVARPDGSGPGGTCAFCPLNAFGSSQKAGAKGKACKESKSIYFLTPDTLIPLIVSAPPTSLANYRKYMLALAGKQRRYDSVVTSITLAQAVNPGGQAYSEMVFTYKGLIPEAQRNLLAPYREGIINTVNKVITESPGNNGTDVPF